MFDFTFSKLKILLKIALCPTPGSVQNLPFAGKKNLFIV